ncbi:hypothetical protein VSR68_24445 [Paraburkholderia phymatum]|uniref:SLAC1 family transporter n=1 Tax=Paraburkholderia phymatum TaxID=148447 RepID=UPI00317070DA
MSATIGTIAVLVFVALDVGCLVKWIRHPAAVRGEFMHPKFMHPIASNFSGTITIAILLLSSVVAPISAPISALLSETVWTIATISTCSARGSRYSSSQPRIPVRRYMTWLTRCQPAIEWSRPEIINAGYGSC